MNSACGSEWRKWDFHVHTPYSLLNKTGFKCNPFSELVNDGQYSFDEYVVRLFSSAVEKEVYAIGITDYFIIEGYRRITEEYLHNSEKMKQLFPDPDIRSKIENIFIFANVEFRSDNIIGERRSPLNFHVIFNGDVDASTIQEQFLDKLQFDYDVGTKRSLNIKNLRSFGEKIKSEEPTVNGDELKVGIERVTIKCDDVREILEHEPALKGKYFFVVPVDEIPSREVSWAGREGQVRKRIYKMCDCYLSSSKNTRTFALAVGQEKQQIEEFGSIKPCIWGSDAHDYERLFEPVDKMYCWIKADLSPEGMRQILCEPADRVIIQPENPSNKDSHHIIHSILFSDQNFQKEEIVFNDNLTAIIGGKSTGKSILLRQLAYSIDSDQVKTREAGIYKKDSPIFQTKPVVTWKDGTTNPRSIVYIPQTYLNRTIDNPEKSTAIDEIIASIMQQEPEISDAYTALNTSILQIRTITEKSVDKYCELISERRTVADKIKSHGTSGTFIETLSKLQAEQNELSSKLEMCQDDIDRYVELRDFVNATEEKIKGLQIEKSRLEAMPLVRIVLQSDCDATQELSWLRSNYPNMYDELAKSYTLVSEIAIEKWNAECKRIVELVKVLLQQQQSSIDNIKDEYSVLSEKMNQNDQLSKLSKRILEEKQNLSIAEALEKRLSELNSEISSTIDRIIESANWYFEAHTSYINVVNSVGTRKTTTLKFETTVVWMRTQFIEALTNLLDNRNFSAFRSKYEVDLTNIDPAHYDESFLRNLWTAMAEPQKVGGVSRKNGFDLASVLKKVYGNWYNIHYSVSSGNDKIDSMSPGKKGLVMLELLINLADTACPILIDQPEDDLDNRSVYNELVSFIKASKNKRQIIVVTHNANVVLGADAEEVIIANQHGNDSPNSKYRFEYRSGAIENNEIAYNADGTVKDGVLNSTGIQTQICEILEGGREAFEHRRTKYQIVQ